MDDRIETPTFVVDENLLKKQVGSFRDALDRGWPGAVLSYYYEIGRASCRERV